MYSNCRGFSLIEIMITIALFVALAAIGLPSYTNYSQNLKVRSSAESFLAAAQGARSEAVRRNTGVELFLTDAIPTPENTATATSVATGANWMTRTTTGTFIDGKLGVEGTNKRSGESSPISISSGGVASIVFNGLGRTNLATPATFQFSNPSAGACVASGGLVRCLNVVIETGGQARLCDPAVPVPTPGSSGDTRACQ